MGRSIPAACRASPAPRKSSPARPPRFSPRPNSVAQTADTVGKTLAAAGWQAYAAPNTQQAVNPSLRIMSLKRGPQALNVFISLAPAQGNATSVSYTAVALKNDLPFPKDASNIEFDPDKLIMTSVSAELIDTTLINYRKHLRRWAGGCGPPRPARSRRRAALPAWCTNAVLMRITSTTSRYRRRLCWCCNAAMTAGSMSISRAGRSAFWKPSTGRDQPQQTEGHSSRRGCGTAAG